MKNMDLKQTIKKYIKLKKIFFEGATVAIIVGGMFLGTININDNNYKYEGNKVASIVAPIKQNQDIIKKDDVVDYDILDIDILESIPNEIKKDDVTPNKKEIVNKVTSNNKNNTNKTNSTTKKTTNKEEIKKEEIKKEATKEKIYIQVYRTNGEILNLELEEYVIGVVGAEMPASFHREALKAQAVIARTYALKAKEDNRKLTDDSSTQNYKNNDELKKMWGSSYNTYYKKIKESVESTKGEYLTYNGEIIDAVYHSTSNGLTEDAVYVWGQAKPYLVSTSSIYDSNNSSFIKEKSISYEELSSKLNQDIDITTTFNIEDKTAGNRVNHLRIMDKVYTGVEIRNILGLRSADFEIKKDEEGLTFITKGYGHGVGLSQYGANGYAKSGYKYKDILNHYYKGVKLQVIK